MVTLIRGSGATCEGLRERAAEFILPGFFTDQQSVTGLALLWRKLRLFLTGAAMQELAEMGVSLAIDDFGTGCSGRSHLPQLAFDAR